MTEKHQLLTDQEFETQFKNCTLAPVLFTHEAHLRLAYIHLRKYSFEEASHNICLQIENFDKRYGKGTKFNKELTITSLEIMKKFIDEASEPGFRKLVCTNPILKTNFSALIQEYDKANLMQTLSKQGLSHSVLYS